MDMRKVTDRKAEMEARVAALGPLKYSEAPDGMAWTPDAGTRAQMADMGRMRTEKELEVQRIVTDIGVAALNLRAEDVIAARKRLATALRPLFNAAYGPLPADARRAPFTAYPKPYCLACGGQVRGQGPLCDDCEDGLEYTPLDLGRLDGGR